MHLNDTVVFLAAILRPQSGMRPGSSICAQNPGSQAADAGWSTVHTWRELSSVFFWFWALQFGLPSRLLPF